MGRGQQGAPNELDPAGGALALRAFSAALAGELTDAPRALAALARTEGALARAWRAAISSAAWMLRPAAFEAPRAGELEALLGAPPAARHVAALACVHLERACVLAFSPDELAAYVAFHERLVVDAGASDSDEARLWLELGHGWLAIMRGDVEGLDARLQDVQKRALGAKIAPLVIDATVQRALAAASAGDIAASTSLARRASRMARTEALPSQEYLAHLVLARARRLNRHAHLAIRILTALERVVPPQYRPWVAWELFMAGDIELARAVLARAPATTRSVAAARAIADLEAAALRAERAAFDRASRAVREHVRGWSIIERDAESVLAATDVRVPLDAVDPQLADWCRGQGALPPPEIYGLCVRAAPPDAEDLSEAYVLATLDAAPRRLLGMGLPLVVAPGLVTLRRTRRRQGRVETVVAILASAGPEGLAEIECFEQAYELTFEVEVHRGVFEVLLHRVRAYLEGAAELVRKDGRLALRLDRPLLVPDPRCAPPVYDRLLRILAREGRATASDAAKQIGLSVRAVQEALKSLAADGACVGEKDGRQILYIVEDTTFSEPTERLAVTQQQE